MKRQSQHRDAFERHRIPTELINIGSTMDLTVTDPFMHQPRNQEGTQQTTRKRRLSPDKAKQRSSRFQTECNELTKEECMPTIASVCAKGEQGGLTSGETIDRLAK